MKETPISSPISTRLRRIAELAREAPNRSFLSLAHHIDLDLLKEAFRLTRKDAAVGVDRVTAKNYAGHLEENLKSLLERFKTGRYRAPAVRRVHIPKGKGNQTRPIGIPTFEDKILQRAVVMILTAVYEQDFLDVSYGFRSGKSPHMALEALRNGIMDQKCGWTLEVDIRSYFGSIDRRKLWEILDQRVRDGVLRRTINKWLKAGVLEKGQVTYPEAGTPQGGVISPLLANIYLHVVLDQWFEQEIKPYLEGRANLIRFCDDFVIAFSSERDAMKVHERLAERFAEYGLALHPEKTRLIRFIRPRKDSRGKGEDGDGQRPGTFNFLGFTHYWGRSRRNNWVVKRKTAADRFRRALSRITQWCKENRHRPIAEQHKMLSQKLRGHYGYYGITGNSSSLSRFEWVVTRLWKKWLERRSQRGYMRWSKYLKLLRRYPLPVAKCIHSIYVT